MSAPAWVTEELGEEWIESSPSPPTTPAALPETENVIRGSLNSKRGSLRSLGHGSAARALPPTRRGSAMSLPEGRSPSNPYVRNASGMLSPPTSASSDDGRDGEHNKSFRSQRSVSAPAEGSVKGTFVVKEGEDSHGKAFPKNPFSQAKDMFSALPLERMFDPPSPPKAIPEEEEPVSGSTTPVQSPPRSPLSEQSPNLTPTEGTPERSTPTVAAIPSTTPRTLSSSPHSFGSTPSSGSEGRRTSHMYAPANPSRLSKSMTPSDNSFTTTASSSRVPTPLPEGEEDMSLTREHDNSMSLPAMPQDEGPTHSYDATGPTHPYDQSEPTHAYDESEHPTNGNDEYSLPEEQPSVEYESSPQTGTQRIRELQSGEVETDLPKHYPFTFAAPVGNEHTGSINDELDAERSETPLFEPSLAPLEGGEPSHSTLRVRPASANLGLRLFRNTYDTYTREHLSALVDSIPIQPSPPSAAAIPNRDDLRDWSPEASGSPMAYRSASDSSTPESITSDSRSSKRLRLSAPRGPAAIRDWRAQGHAMLERIRVTDPDMSLTSDSRSGSRSGSEAWSVRSASASREVARPTFDYGTASPSPEPEPVVKSNPSTASSTYLHRAEDMMSRIKNRIVSPTSTTDVSPTDGSSAPGEQSRVVSGSSQASSAINTTQSSEAETHIPRHDFSWKGKAREISPAQNSAEGSAATSQRATIEGAGPPPRPLNHDDLNRFVSATTVATATTMSTSFVKHRGPRDPASVPPMTMIRPGDVQDVVPDRIGKMRYDRSTMRWVRDTRDSLTRVSEAGESGRVSEDSADPFAGFDTTSPSVDNAQLPTSDHGSSPEKSPNRQAQSSSPGQAPQPQAQGGFPDSSLEKGFSSPEKNDMSSSSPEKYALDSSPEKEDQEATPRARPRLGHSFSAPPVGTPGPLRSALRNPNTSTPASAMKKRAAWHADLTPARGREASAAPSSGSNRRSVSFSDGYVIAQHIEAERAEWSRADGRGRVERFEQNTIIEEGNSSILPSMRTRRIQEALDGMAELQIDDIDEEDEDEMPDSSPSKTARPSTSAVQKSQHAPAEVSEDDSDSTVPITAFKSFRSFRRGGADQTFLTECSFGVAHDRLVQLITDVQPFEPYWEQLRSIDLSNKGVESLARLKEFLPALDEAKLNDNQIDYLSGIPSSVRTLHVAGNRLSSLTSVNHLRNLHFLDISRNQLDSVSQLDCLHHMRELVVDNNQITDLNGIMGIDCLVKLSIAGNAIEHVDLTHAKWDSLESLDLSRNKIKTIRGLERLKSLTTLKLDSNALVELQPSSSMSNLRILRVSDNDLSTLDVSLFPRIRTLFADNNALPGVTRSGSGGHRIENLSLRSQRVQAFSLTPEDVQSAKRLYISGNRLDGDFLRTPVYSLVYLEAVSCNLASWPANLALNAPNLRVLNVNFNFITSLDGLRGLTRLRKLSAIGNRLGEEGNAARGLQGLSSLEEVDLRSNPATLNMYLPVIAPTSKPKPKKGDANEAREGKEDESRGGSMPNDANWAALDAQYRRQLPDKWYSRRLFYRGLVLAACPHLRSLDAVKVTEGERRKAAQLLEYANDVASA